MALITKQQAAARLGYKFAGMIDRLEARGLITLVRVPGGRPAVDERDVEALISRYKQPAAKKATPADDKKSATPRAAKRRSKSLHARALQEQEQLPQYV